MIKLSSNYQIDLDLMKTDLGGGEGRSHEGENHEGSHFVKIRGFSQSCQDNMVTWYW